MNILKTFPEEAAPLRLASHSIGEIPLKDPSGRDEYRTITFHVGGKEPSRLLQTHSDAQQGLVLNFNRA